MLLLASLLAGLLLLTGGAEGLVRGAASAARRLSLYAGYLAFLLI